MRQGKPSLSRYTPPGPIGAVVPATTTVQREDKQATRAPGNRQWGWGLLVTLVLLALAAWCTSCSPSSTTQQETTQQQATQQKTAQQEATQQKIVQQETTQQKTVQAPPSATTPGSDLTASFVGTWDETFLNGESVPSGTQVLTFSEDGTLQSTSNDGSPDTNFTAQYSVLDESRIVITLQDGTSYEDNYSLDGDVLTLTAEDQTSVFQRTG